MGQRINKKVKSWTNSDLFKELCNLSPIGQAMAIQALTQFSDAVIADKENLLKEAGKDMFSFIHPQVWINAAEEIKALHGEYQTSHV